MRRAFSGILFAVWMCGALAGCGSRAEPPQAAEPSAASSAPTERAAEPSDAETTASQSASEAQNVKMTVDGREIRITLYDTPTAKTFYAALPMELTFSDYNGTEKIAYPPDALPTDGEPDGCDPAIGDLCLYAPWGNLCVFYRDFRYSPSLIKLGHVEDGLEYLSGATDDFIARIERVD